MNRLFFLVNSISDLSPGMTTLRMLAAGARLGYDAHVAELDGLIHSDGEGVAARARPVPRASAAEVLAALPGRSATLLPIRAADTLIVRVNPARFGHPAMHRWLLAVLEWLELSGTRVLNGARTLRLAGSKAYLSCLPDAFRPAQAVIANVESGLEACARLGPKLVLKPAYGTRGRGVVAAEGPASRLRPLLELLLEHGPVVVQPELPDAGAGDTRVLYVDGHPLEIQGEWVAIHRTPAAGEFRSNLHRGGAPAIARLTGEQRDQCLRLGRELARRGLTCVGADLVGLRVLELNVWAPGGLGPFETLRAVDASEALLRALLASAKPPPGGEALQTAPDETPR